MKKYSSYSSVMCCGETKMGYSFFPNLCSIPISVEPEKKLTIRCVFGLFYCLLFFIFLKALLVAEIKDIFGSLALISSDEVLFLSFLVFLFLYPTSFFSCVQTLMFSFLFFLYFFSIFSLCGYFYYYFTSNKLCMRVFIFNS